MNTNLPVPAGPRAPISHKWVWWIGPPLLLTLLYRQIPPRIRRLWSGGSSSSHFALAAILAGGGWAALVKYAIPYGSIVHPARNKGGLLWGKR